MHFLIFKCAIGISWINSTHSPFFTYIHINICKINWLWHFSSALRTTFFIVHVYWKSIISAIFFLKSLYFAFLYEIYFTLCNFKLIVALLFPHTLKIPLYCLSAHMVSDDKIVVILSFVLYFVFSEFTFKDIVFIGCF